MKASIQSTNTFLKHIQPSTPTSSTIRLKVSGWILLLEFKSISKIDNFILFHHFYHHYHHCQHYSKHSSYYNQNTTTAILSSTTTGKIVTIETVPLKLSKKDWNILEINPDQTYFADEFVRHVLNITRIYFRYGDPEAELIGELFFSYFSAIFQIISKFF